MDNKTVGRKIIEEPLGWDEDQKEYARHKRHGIFPKMSNSLFFFGESQRLLDFIWDVEGVKAQIIIIKEERHPQTNRWTRAYWGFLDMLTREVEDGIVSFKFNSGGVEALRASRESQKVEIESLRTIDGETLPPLQTEVLELDGREIFLRSKFEVSNTDNEAKVSVDSNAGNTRYNTVGIPLKISSNSHPEIIHSVIPETTTGVSASASAGGATGIMFMINNSSLDMYFKLNIDATMDLFCQQHENVQWAKYWVCLTKYENGSSYDLKERIPLYKLEENHPWFGNAFDYAMPQFTQQGVQVDYSNDNFELLQGESLAFECWLGSDMYVDNNAGVRVQAKNIVSSTPIIEQDSYFPASQIKVVLAKELVERILHITTGTKTQLYSEALGRTDLGYAQDGIAALKAYAHGMWIRGYDQLPENEENRYKAFTTSLKDVLDDMEVTDNLGLGIERIGYTERYIIEPREFFYQDVVAYRLPYKANKVKRKVTEEHLYGSINIGFNEGFENEEAQGLDDYHANSSWNTTLGIVSNIYQRISKFIASSYAVEFIRRKPKSLYETYDHRNDNKVFIFDLKRYIPGLFKEKKYQDQLSQEPTGIFSPQTATKLLYSPLNLLLRHVKFFTSGFTKYPLDYVRLGEAKGNKSLKTKPIGGIERKESDDVQNIDLGRPLFLPEEIEFEHEVDFLTNEAIQGYTEINGRKVPNLYLMWEFTNEKGEIEKGFIENISLNDGKWKLLKANR